MQPMKYKFSIGLYKDFGHTTKLKIDENTIFPLNIKISIDKKINKFTIL